MRVAAALGALFVVVSAACVTPAYEELACNNGVDDDHNGLTDCEDPSCQASGRCEITPAACRNGVDDDANGQTDCDDRTCVARRLCEPFEAPCDLVAQTGCPVGMGCYVKGTYGDKRQECRLPGTIAPDAECNDQGSCTPGHGCFNGCTRFCTNDYDCPFASLCVRAENVNPAGFCLISCNPLVVPSCPGGADCVPYSSLGARYANGGALWFCMKPPPVLGTAPLGARCDDPPDLAKPAGMCDPKLVCVPDVSGHGFCRQPCARAAPWTGQSGAPIPCPAGLSCIVPYAFDDRAFQRDQLLEVGACVEP